MSEEDGFEHLPAQVRACRQRFYSLFFEASAKNPTMVRVNSITANKFWSATFDVENMTIDQVIGHLNELQIDLAVGSREKWKPRKPA